MDAELLLVFVKRSIKPLGKIFWTQKTDCQNLFSSWSYKSSKFNFVCSRISPLYFWSCYTGFINSRDQVGLTAVMQISIDSAGTFRIAKFMDDADWNCVPTSFIGVGCIFLFTWNGGWVLSMSLSISMLIWNKCSLGTFSFWDTSAAKRPRWIQTWRT